MRPKDDPLDANLIRGNTPLLVLAILGGGRAHGYAIASEIARRSENTLEFKQGTLYPLLHELERDGFITSEWEIPAGERPRRVYTITDEGKKELTRRMQAWRRFSTAMIRVTGVSPDENSG